MELNRENFRWKMSKDWNFPRDPENIENFEIVQFEKFHGVPRFRNNHFGWIKAVNPWKPFLNELESQFVYFSLSEVSVEARKKA